MTAQIIALAAAIAYALSFILSKRGFKNSTPITITFVSLLIQTITLFTIALTITGIPTVTPFVFMLFAIAGVLQAVVRQLTYIGIEKIGAARSGPIRASVPLWSAAIAIFFLGETITASIGLGTILVVGGILLISWRADEHVKDFRPWFVIAPLLAAILGGVVYPIRRYALRFADEPIFFGAVVGIVGLFCTSAFLALPKYPSPKGHGQVRGYLVRPAKVGGKLPAVVVVHENRGLNPYIEDVARRLAKAGYLALAPDGLSSVGAYPGNDDKVRELQRQVDPEKLMNDFFAAIEFLLTHERSTGKVGITGFCYDGGVCNAASVAYPELAAAVPFYGRQAKPEDVGRIRAPLLFQFAEKDDNVNATWPAYEAALKKAGKTYEAHLYPGTGHGFHKDSAPRYDEAAANVAWERTDYP